MSAAFIGLTARLKSSEVAVSTGGFYLSVNLGSLFGVGIASMLIETFVERTLRNGLEGVPDREKVSFELPPPYSTIQGMRPCTVAFLTSPRFYETFCQTWTALIVFQEE